MIFSENRRPLFGIMLKVAKESDSGTDRPMIFSEHLRMFMEACVSSDRAAQFLAGGRHRGCRWAGADGAGRREG
jgi:hypothetical protein